MSPENKHRMILMSGSMNGPNQAPYDYNQHFLHDYFAKELPSHADVLFVAWAQWSNKGKTHDPNDLFGYAQKQWGRFNLELDPLHKVDEAHMEKRINNADMIIVGGGSIHTLTQALHDNKVIFPIHYQIRSGAIYVGTSAGTVVACPTMSTANEPHIFALSSTETLSLVPFQINPHYPMVNDHLTTSFGPPRKEVMFCYQAFNEDSLPVVCLPDGSYLVRNGDSLRLEGGDAKIITPKLNEYYYDRPQDLSFLLDTDHEFYSRK